MRKHCSDGKRIIVIAAVVVCVWALASGAGAEGYAVGKPIFRKLSKHTPSPTHSPTPTPAPPTPTPLPTSSPTPTPGNTGNEVTITSPADGQTISGSVVTVYVTLGPDVYWDQLMVDSTAVSSGSGDLNWDSTTGVNGKHLLTVRVFQKGGTSPIGTAWVTANVSNASASASPTPTPAATPTPAGTSTPVATPTPTPGPVYFPTLPSSAALPTDAQCATLIAPTAETASWNTPFNETMPTAAQLASYAAGGYTFGYRDSYAQYQRVDGQYTGSTDMIMRWAACKYGVDENVVRAQAWIESGWKQGAAGDKRTTLSACVQGSFTALWNTSIAEPNGGTITCPSCCYQSWSAWQTKIFYDWMTWPEIMQSTAFAADYRFADQRACMNGDYTSYFASVAQQPNTYAADIINYKNNPDTTNTNIVLWGCIGMHYSGRWYDSGAQTYIGEVQNVLTTAPWPN